MNYLLIVLLFTSSLLLGPVLDAKGDGDPWEDGETGKDAQTTVDSTYGAKAKTGTTNPGGDTAK